MFTAHHYQKIVLQSIPRVLNLLDRNPSSATYGCFDRAYWLHRKTDYPVSTAQMLSATLAHLYKNDFPGNVYYQNKQVLGWVLAALKFALSIQHADGSFDEWYPNERGWAGPTGYVAHALCEVLDLLGEEVPEEWRKKAELGLERAARHLNHRDEKDILANHYAIALLPLFQIGKILGSKEILGFYENWKKRFLKLQTPEGWFLEYDGCDLGYALGTLDFLASLHRIHRDEEIRQAAQRCFQFLSYFAYPDGEWAGALGSRHTTHSYPFALEYWANEFPEGHALLHHQRAAVEKGLALLAGDQEDHYLAYRLRDYLKAADHFHRGELAVTLPYEKGNSRISFPLAKMEIFTAENYRVWIAAGRGGAFRVYEKSSGKLLQKNSGVILQEAGGKVFGSLWQGSNYSVDGDSITIDGSLEPIFQKRFSPGKFLLFRLVCLFSRNKNLAYGFKVLIRKWMITHSVSSPYVWKRELRLDPKVVAGKDSISGSRGGKKKTWWGGEYHTRYVPQGNYFLPSDLYVEPITAEGDWKRWQADYRIGPEKSEYSSCVE